MRNILWFEEIAYTDVPKVGGKNASLGEMYSQLRPKGVNIPHGFVLTADAYWYFLKFNKIDLKLKQIFSKFNPKSLQSLALTGKACRDLILKTNFPDDLQREILASYRKLS
ncbi:MAG: PEP/pyruvate-binding domain-containing protein, partial [Candidatus Pacebacteria bacterium]|nr:PEP/pyruvate-binding domain-containing protein [Candidatus Paceibacterota bacterium]